MEKKQKRELKQTIKRIGIFLLIAFPLILVVSFLMYYFIPSLRTNIPIVVTIMVALGGITFVIYEIIYAKIKEKSEKKPKKFDPYSD